MKTQAIEWSYAERRDGRIAPEPASTLPRSLPHELDGALSLLSRILLAAVSALVILVGTAWLVTLPQHVLYLQAAIWAGGLVFVALAVESDSPLAATLQLATGIALPVLAWLSSRMAVELAIVAAALVAAWAVAAILKR